MTISTIQTMCPSCSYVQVMAANCCECGNSLRPQVPADFGDLDGDAWQTLADSTDAYEKAIQTPTQQAFAKLVGQHAKGLLTDSDLYGAVVMLITSVSVDDLFAPEPEVTKALVGHGPTATYRMTDEHGKFLGFSARP